MNIFGIGGAELILILLIMLIVAGPKRMIRWAYVLGVYVGKLRVVWAQMVDVMQNEVNQAGLDIQIPKEPPTRANLNRMASNAFKPISQPIDDAVQGVRDDVNTVKKEAAFGTWSGQTSAAGDTQTDSTEPESAATFGTWSQPNRQDSEQ